MFSVCVPHHTRGHIVGSNVNDDQDSPQWLWTTFSLAYNYNIFPTPSPTTSYRTLKLIAGMGHSLTGHEAGRIIIHSIGLENFLLRGRE